MAAAGPGPRAGHCGGQEGIRDHPGNRPPVRTDPGLGPDGRVPGAEPARPLQRPDARHNPGPLPHGRRAGRHHRPDSADPPAAYRLPPVNRRPSPDGDRHRRESQRPERPVRPRLTLGRGPAAVGDGAAERQPSQLRRLPHRIPRPAGVAGAGCQHGMLAAVGATRKQLRMVMVAGGAVVGVIAAVAGTIVGLAAWIAAAPGLDTFAGHRIDRLNIPWGLVALGMLLAVVTATAAAWWPARAAARLPVTLALSARPPRPRPAHRPAILAALAIVAGVVFLGLANQTRPPLIIAGALAMTLGILLISPLAIRVLAALGRRAPVAVRLALRDLARHQARSAAALAAISLALGITAAIIISSASDKSAANAGNLSDTQILVWIGQVARIG